MRYIIVILFALLAISSFAHDSLTLTECADLVEKGRGEAALALPLLEEEAKKESAVQPLVNFIKENGRGIIR